MLKLEVKIEEFFNEVTSTFTEGANFTLTLEHSLVSLSKWEEALNKSFLSSPDKTSSEIRFYIQCMLLGDVDPNCVDLLTADHIRQINDYIEAPHTATTFSSNTIKGKSEIVTAETIYFWMINFNIPMECQYWHLNKLMALIRLASIKNANNSNKMSKAETARKNRELNEQRLAKLGSRG